MIEFADVFSTSHTDVASCFLLRFEVSVPLDSPPVISLLYRVNSLVAKQINTILDMYLAAGRIQHSTSLYASPLVIRTKSGGIRLTIN